MRDARNNPYVEMIRKYVLDFMKDEAVKIYLFGSWARGEARRSSDVDIAIDAGGDLNASKISALRDFFEESTIPYRVDVVDMRFASDSLKREILKDGVVWKDE